MNAQPASWVIREKDTGAVIMETYDKNKVDILNTSKYEAVPINEHLAGINQAMRFKKIANALLEKHYGIHLNDTDMCEDRTVFLLMENHVPIHEAVAGWAFENDLVRIDKQGFYGVPSKDEITEEDELAAIKQLGL